MILSLAVLQQPTAAELAANLFQVAGLASPVGGEYRSVTIRIPLISFGERDIKINAWVVEDQLTGVKRIIAWNGMTYKPVVIGDQADLEADVTRGRAIREGFIASESMEYHAAFTTSGPAAKAMLQQFGRPELAERVGAAHFFMFSLSNDPREAAVSMVDRILCDAAAARIIHAQDWEALLLCRKARRFRNVLEEVSGPEDRSSYARRAGRAVLDEWISNMNLRISKPSRLPSVSNLARMSREKRIAVLVEHLDETTGARSYFAGEEPPVLDSPAYLLLKEGDAGIDALIGALEDTRMTRAVFGNMTPMSPYHFSSVGDVAGRLLESSIGVTGFSSDPAKRHAQIRSFWAKSKGKPQEVRWLIALEDDTLGPTAWHNAALSLSVPSWIKPSGTGMMSGTGGLPEHFTGPSIKWVDLYAKSRDRVYRILEKRVIQMSQGDSRSKIPVHDMIVAAAVWNLERALPLLRVERARIQNEAKMRPEGPNVSDLVSLSEVVSPLVFAGVEDAWEGYADLVDAVQPTRPGEPDRALAPLWQHPDDPVAKSISDRVFKATSPWGAARNTALSIGTANSVFLFLPAYQRGLVEGLRDKSFGATATRMSERSIRYPLLRNGSAFGSGGATISPETAGVKVGEEFELRYCDLLLEKLKGSLGLSGFDLAMPVAKRDEWIDRALQIMEQENFAWPGQTLPSLFITHPVFVSRAIWPEPLNRLRPGTFIRRGGG